MEHYVQSSGDKVGLQRSQDNTNGASISFMGGTAYLFQTCFFLLFIFILMIIAVHWIWAVCVL